MPAFVFMTGASLPYSCAARIARGDPAWKLHLHVVFRSTVFILLGLLFTSRGYAYTRYNFTGLLTQVAVAYPFAYLLVGRGIRTQALACGAILLGTWLAFALYPAPCPGFDYRATGLAEGVEPLTGFFSHWNRGTNLAAAFDPGS